MRKGIGWMVERGLGFVTAGRKKAEVEKMRKGLSIIAGIAILLFAYSASAAVVTSNLVSWWKFDETSGTTAYDSEGSNTGTVNGAGIWTTDTAGSASSGALYFDGSWDYVRVPDDDSLDITNDLTLEAWVKSSTMEAYEYIATKNAPPYTPEYPFALRMDSGNLGFFYGDGTADRSFGGLGSSIGTNWVHVAVVRDMTAAKVRFYTNGQLLVERDNSYGSAVANTNDVTIGLRIDGFGMFSGIMDEVRIYDRALSQPEIEQNYNAIPEPSTLLLLGGGLLSLLAFRRIKAKV